MSMWKIIVSPKEDKNAWENFVQQSIVAIGWCDRSMDDELPVQRFRQICEGDWVLAHLPSERSGTSFLTVGLGRVKSDYQEVRPDSSDEWEGSFRRQYMVDWVSTNQQPMPDILRRCNYRTTVCKLSSELEIEILRLYRIFE